jgi:type IV pilus assembly protein PilP
MNRVTRIGCVVAAMAMAMPLYGQQAPPAGQGQQPAAGAVQAPSTNAEQPPAAPKPPYNYDPSGRRDPFVSLLGRGADPKSRQARPAGLAGMLINEVSLKGIMRDRSGFVAMVHGPDNKTYIVKPGDRLMDGTVKSILADAVIFSQDVNDPLSLVKQREIKKSLRSEESRG